MTPFVSLPGSEHMDTVRVAVYARQSTARPDASEASPEAQVAAGEALASSRGRQAVHRFKDVGRSGWDPKAVRPGCESLTDVVRAGEVDVVVVNELSRLTRKGAKEEIKTVGGRHSSSAPYGMWAVREKIGNLVVSVLEPDEDNPGHVAIVERMMDMSWGGVSANATTKMFIPVEDRVSLEWRPLPEDDVADAWGLAPSHRQGQQSR